MSRPRRVDASKRTRAPHGFLGLVAIVVAFEAFVAAHDVDFTELSATDWRLTRRAAAREARDADLLILGDSLLKFGLVPDVIERRTGLRTYNLSLLGGQAPTTYYLLRRALEAGARPRAILVDCQDLPSHPGLDVRGLGLPFHMRCWPELLDPDEALELGRSARDPSFVSATMIRRVLPSFKARREVRTGLATLLRKGDTASRRHYKTQERNWRINRGSLVMAPKATNPTLVTPERMAEPRSEWSLDPVTADYLPKVLRLAADRGIAVFWLIPPTSPEHEGLRVTTGQHEYYSKVAADLQAEFSNLVVIDGRSPGYTRGVFIDDSHLDRNGAIACSGDVAEVLSLALRRAESAGRWVALPPYRERPTPGVVEDMDQSRLALGVTTSRGRARR